MGGDQISQCGSAGDREGESHPTARNREKNELTHIASRLIPEVNERIEETTNATKN